MVSNTERMAKIEKDIEYIKSDSQEFKITLNETRKEITDTRKHIDDKLDSLIDIFDTKLKDERDNNKELFASKFVEKIFWIVVSTVVTMLVTAAMYMLIKGV